MTTLFSLLLVGCLDTVPDTDKPDDSAPIEDTQPETPDVVELLYDDGDPETGSSPWENEPGGVLAVHFTPPDGDVRLVGARFYVGPMGEPLTPFGVRVFAWDAENGQPLVDLLGDQVEAVATEAGGFVAVDLSQWDLPVTGTEFAVGMEWLTAAGLRGRNAQFLGVDESEPDGRSYWRFATDPVWRPNEVIAGRDGDFLIQAIVEVWP